MIHRLAPLFLVLGLVACKSKPATTTPPTGDDTEESASGPTCADAAANAKVQLGSEAGPDKADQAAVMLEASCNDDHWSDEAKKCVAESSGEELEGCKSYLDADVATKLDANMEAIFDSGGGDEEDDAVGE